MNTNIKRNRRLIALFSGILFGSGLFISGMGDPNKVVGFLNVVGDWDPSLLFVMAGAFGVYMPIYQLYIKKRINVNKTPILADEYKAPTSNKIDLNLLSGAAMFGFGWGMVGICPGPALASLLLGKYSIIIFVLSMIVGIRLACWVKEKRNIECTNKSVAETS